MFISEKSDDKLRRAIMLYQEREMRELDDEMKANPIYYQFSKRYEKRINRLLKISGKSYFRYINTFGKRAAVIMIAIFTALSITTFSVEALRTPVVNFFIEIYEKFTAIVFHSDDSTNISDGFPESILEIRVPKNIPDGYMLSDIQNHGTVVQVTYSIKNENPIDFEQGVIANTITAIDTEGIVAENIEINGYDAVHYKNKGISTLVWTDGEYGYKLSGAVEKDILVMMTELKKSK